MTELRQLGLKINIKDVNQLKDILNKMKNVKNVSGASRVGG